MPLSFFQKKSEILDLTKQKCLYLRLKIEEIKF